MNMRYKRTARRSPTSPLPTFPWPHVEANALPAIFPPAADHYHWSVCWHENRDQGHLRIRGPTYCFWSDRNHAVAMGMVHRSTDTSSCWCHPTAKQASCVHRSNPTRLRMCRSYWTRSTSVTEARRPSLGGNTRTGRSTTVPRD